VIPQQQLQVVEQQIIWQQDIMVEPSHLRQSTALANRKRAISVTAIPLDCDYRFSLQTEDAQKNE
jgi:hypothetical protein